MQGAWFAYQQLHVHAPFQLDDAPAQVGFGDAGALRLTIVSVAISMLALLVSELLARVIGKRMSME